MKQAQELRSVLDRRTWDKEVVLWQGSDKALVEMLANLNAVSLDILDLLDQNNLSTDDDDNKATIREAIRGYLKNLPKGPEHPCVLVVRSIGLLARYRIGLKEFYDWFVGSHAMVILVLGDLADPTGWPEEVRCDSNRLVEYFLEPGMVKETYVAEG